MKVSFDASFRELQRYLNSDSLRINKNSPSKFLQDISPSKPQQPEIAGSFELKTTPQADETAFRASYRFPETTMGIPTSSERIKPKESDTLVNTPSTSVNAPTILSAKRISGGDPFLSLSHAERLAKVKEIVQAVGNKQGIDPALSLAMVAAESNFDPGAISTDGHESKGLMQLLDSTAKSFLRKAGLKEGEYHPFNPHLNVEVGVSYLRHLHDIFSADTLLPNSTSTVAAANSSSLEKLAVAAYNAGEGRVASAQERAKQGGRDPSLYHQIETYLPEMTQEYVKRVMEFKANFES